MKKMCHKAIIPLLLIGLLCPIPRDTAYAAENELVKIDQVYADLPEMQVYFHLLDKDGDAVSRTVSESEVLMQYGNEKGEIGSVRNAAADKTQIYFLLDISDSMPTDLFESIKAELLRHYQARSENEKYTLITFGKEVVVQLDGDEPVETVESKINALQNTDANTVLYDAISKVSELTATRSEYTRRLVYLFTDGEDWTVGGHTLGETQELIQQGGTPTYAFGVSLARKQDLDALSELARISGGRFISVTSDSLSEAVKQISRYVDAGYVADVALKSNAIAAQSSSVVLQIDGASDSRTVNITNWQEDNTAPIITEVYADGNALYVAFSENTQGGSTAADYTIISGEHKYPVESVSRVSGKEMKLLLTSPLYDGKYLLSISDLTDTSIEKNALTGTYSFEITGTPYTAAAFFRDNMPWIAAGILMCIAVAIFIIVGKKKDTVFPSRKNESEHIEAGKASEKYHVHATGGKLVHLAISGRNLARRDVELRVEGTILLGRSVSCDVRIDDEQISRRNTELTCRNDRLFVNNVSQTNGTMLNGLMISSERELHSGDTIMLGNTRIVVAF